MCCAGYIEDSTELLRLLHSKKKSNRKRKVPSMCIDAVLECTIRRVRRFPNPDELLASRAKFRRMLRERRRASTKRTSELESHFLSGEYEWSRKKESCKSEEENCIDEELEELLGMDKFFERLKQCTQLSQKKRRYEPNENVTDTQRQSSLEEVSSNWKGRNICPVIMMTESVPWSVLFPW